MNNDCEWVISVGLLDMGKDYLYPIGAFCKSCRKITPHLTKKQVSKIVNKKISNRCCTKCGRYDKLYNDPNVTRKRNIVAIDEECVYCGSKKKLTVDHVIPKSKGGKNDYFNLVACCEPCNIKKGADPAPEMKYGRFKKEN